MKIQEHLSNNGWAILATIARKEEKPQFPRVHTLKLVERSRAVTPAAVDMRIRYEGIFAQNIDKCFNRFIRCFAEADLWPPQLDSSQEIMENTDEQ
jgi:hypothetical protein